MVNLVFIGMSLISGLWVPIYMLPNVMQDIAIAFPAFHLGQLTLKVIDLDSGRVRVVPPRAPGRADRGSAWRWRRRGFRRFSGR